ncbi:hypothetical protein JIX56_28785 [Streptomyces sp. CA-210063]|uniref:hypothetical protein n=1 Tax=Streptomyces sp. CA-210063 TaxID=2801029 RepID=UPI00214B3DD7|nr:hypothetical protein [Streptomyces sp. CA-210063]UUU33526.1 hypothetical protein JIX56_28785 [Streptomyces sp. CA-210063]
MNLKQAIAGVDAKLGTLRASLGRADTAMNKVKTGSSQLNSALGKLKTSATQSGSGLGKLKSEASGLNTGVGKAKGGADKLKSSLDKLKSSANSTKTALQGVKKQADAVEKSVGQAGKNADKGGKSMGNLGKGLKGASLAQKGLNLAMAASPFGLIMTLLAPLIAQFVNMDKVAALVKRGLVAAWSAIKNASSSAARMLGPLFKGVVNGFLLPSRMLIRGLNMLISSLNRVKIKVPDWVPVIGGRGFQFNLPSIPVPQLAKGGVVQARSGGTLALLGEAGEHEAVIPLSKLERMLGSGGGLRTLASAVERLADRPVVVQVDSQEIARAVFLGQRQLARR